MFTLLRHSRAHIPTTKIPSLIPSTNRTFTTTRPLAKEWTGRPADDHVARDADKHNVQHDQSKKGREERSKAQESHSSGISERDSRGSKEKTKEEFPEAPDVIGMEDERGGKSGH